MSSYIKTLYARKTAKAIYLFIYLPRFGHDVTFIGFEMVVITRWRPAVDPYEVNDYDTIPQ